MTFRPLAVAAACLILSACGANPAREAIRAGSGNGSAREAGQAHARNFLEVLARVEPVAEADCRQYNPGANCDFLFLVDDRPGMPPNAFQTLDASGRPILAFTISLISAVQNGDELAFVMSHEAAHHIAGHLDRMDRNALVGAAVFGQIASAAVGATADSIRQAQMIGAEVGARSYSKEFELEADRLGTLVAIQAGFDPVRGTEFFLRLPDPGDRFMGTHPSNAERIDAVRAAAAGL